MTPHLPHTHTHTLTHTLVHPPTFFCIHPHPQVYAEHNNIHDNTHAHPAVLMRAFTHNCIEQVHEWARWQGEAGRVGSQCVHAQCDGGVRSDQVHLRSDQVLFTVAKSNHSHFLHFSLTKTCDQIKYISGLVQTLISMLSNIMRVFGFSETSFGEFLKLNVWKISPSVIHCSGLRSLWSVQRKITSTIQ